MNSALERGKKGEESSARADCMGENAFQMAVSIVHPAVERKKKADRESRESERLGESECADPPAREKDQCRWECREHTMDSERHGRHTTVFRIKHMWQLCTIYKSN